MDAVEAAQFQTLIKAIAQVRFGNGKCPSVVRQFLIDQLKYNDNTANPVSSLSIQNEPMSELTAYSSIPTRSTYAL